MPNNRELTAPCGLDCFNCEIYEDNLTDQMAEFIHAKMGVPKDEIPCKGCRQQDGKHFHLSAGSCATLDCAKRRRWSSAVTAMTSPALTSRRWPTEPKGFPIT